MNIKTKKIIACLLLCNCIGFASAQHIDKIISKNYVDNLIKVLSGDEMQGRRPFTTGIDKAASFIEQEFSKIGLQYLPNAKSYRQTFNKYELKPEKVVLTINGKEIAAENVFFTGAKATQIDFKYSDSLSWTKLDPNKEYLPQYRALARSGKKQLVLVDAKFSEQFKKSKESSLRTSIVDEKDLTQKNAMVFVLASDSISNFTVSIASKATKMPLFNVAGVLPGKSKEKELVIFSGHYDHLGIAKNAIDQDSIMNGADDDASGTTAVIALAKYYKKLNNNQRTLIFVAFTAEEMGGFGAKYFSEQLNPDQVVAMFNIEMIGKDAKFGPNTAYITGFDKSDFGKILQKNLEGSAFSFHPDPYPKQNLFYRSDNATLAALGVPAHTISTVQIEDDKLYHTVKDEYSSLNAENILATIKGIALSAISIVKGEDTPTRIPKLNAKN
ncbi:MAG: M20/M25/M40 family metallo-hydrolase [Sphingobacteriaceae bacterium]|nr:M20/M25/M40 family metallo-hydrolase [Sphingobacteriaceae bacterium]